MIFMMAACRASMDLEAAAWLRSFDEFVRACTYFIFWSVVKPENS
jgi:hypothetical protein